MCWVLEGRRGEATANAVKPARAKRAEIFILGEAGELRSIRQREKDEVGD
jgi:NADPH-dependent ferric siderophore reductase